MGQKVRDIIDKLKKRSAENRERVHYDLPRSFLLLLITLFICWTPPRERDWLLLGLNTASVPFAAIHDYKEDGELTGTSIFFIVLDVLLIGFLCFLFLK